MIVYLYVGGARCTARLNYPLVSGILICKRCIGCGAVDQPIFKSRLVLRYVLVWALWMKGQRFIALEPDSGWADGPL
jgi:hypothetical protein